MKIFQISNDECYWLTPYQSLAEITGKYPPNIQFVEAPDYVFEGWGYRDGEFIKPTPPEGFEYDDATGTFYEIGYQEQVQIRLLKEQLAATDYKAIKYAEGFISDEDYEEIREERQAMRDEINDLEFKIARKKRRYSER